VAQDVQQTSGLYPGTSAAPTSQPGSDPLRIPNGQLALTPDGSSANRPAPTQEDPTGDLERRVAELERRLAQSSAPGAPGNPSADQAVPLPPTGAPGEAIQAPVAPALGAGVSSHLAGPESSLTLAGWDDGFFLKSADGSFVLRITGQLQEDFRGFLNTVDRTDTDTFLLRRARLGIEATMLDYYEFRLLPDFAGTALNTIITDAYMNVHYWEGLQFEAGKFKQPVSYEQLIQDRYTPFMERSMIDQLVPARDVGVMVHGHQMCDDRFEYAVAVSNGEINGGTGNTDTNDHKDLNARVAVRPFNDDDWDLLRHLQFGVSGGVGIENESISPTKLTTPATVPWLVYSTGVMAEGERTRLSPELVYFYHSFGFASQYYHEEQQIATSATATAARVPFDGYYVMATYLLTGEERHEYTQQIDPIHPFAIATPFACPGAWEAVARVSRLTVGEDMFTDHLADPTKYSSGALESTVGFNWYWNKWVRAQFNWEHAHFDDPVALGNASHPLTNHQDTLYCRFQFIF
jgi:phosphate-selective porin OprO/OprP